MRKIYLAFAAMAMIVSQISAQQILVNGNFEAAISAPLPGVGQTTGWGTGIYSGETTSPYQGTRSAKVETLNSPQINQVLNWGSDTITGLLLQTVNGPVNNPADLVFTFAFKYTRVASDTGIFLVDLYDTLQAGDADDLLLYQGALEFTSTVGNWTVATVPMAANPNATGTVNQLFCAIVSSNNAVPSPGTTLWIDDIVSGYVGINETPETYVKVYPNPANDLLNVAANEAIEGVEIYGFDGKLEKTEASTSINVADLNTGMYIYIVKTVSGKSVKGNFSKI